MVLGEIRNTFSYKLKHWCHVSLRTTAAGLTTTPIPIESKIFEVVLDFCAHQLIIQTNHGDKRNINLRNLNPVNFTNDVQLVMKDLNIQLSLKNIDSGIITSSEYDAVAINKFWIVLSQIDSIFKRFKGTLRGETSPVQLWPHHFDLAMFWCFGRLVPGIDPEDDENAAEQMNFGFVTGDESIPEPYFYVTAYPLPEEFSKVKLPADVFWYSGNWQGAIMKYQDLIKSEKPDEKLFNYLSVLQHEGAKLMK